MRSMKSFLGLVAAVMVLSVPMAADAQQKVKREKFGADKRSALIKDELRTIKTSNQNFKWKMVLPWTKGLLFYDMAVHFAETVKLASGGRLDIKVYSAGELVGAMEIFDAVSKGSAEVGHDWPGYWKGKNENFISFGSVPYGLDTEGYNIWLYERGGLEQMQELYAKFGLYVLPGGNAGQEMGFFSNKKAKSMADFKGLRTRTWGWFADIINIYGGSNTPLPGGEVYMALERGVIDAAEFSSPAANWPMGFDEVTKYVISPGAHQPSCQFSFFFNKKAWDSLPPDLKWIVDTAAKETQLWSWAWQENLNIEAIKMFKQKVEFVQMGDDAVTEFAKITKKYLEEVKAKHPEVKKTLDSQEQLKKDFANWRTVRMGLVPWPLDDFINGKRTQ